MHGKIGGVSVDSDYNQGKRLPKAPFRWEPQKHYYFPFYIYFHINIGPTFEIGLKPPKISGPALGGVNVLKESSCVTMQV